MGRTFLFSNNFNFHHVPEFHFTGVCLLFVVLQFFMGARLFSQDLNFDSHMKASYCLTERTDLRRYDNGKYVGLFSREIRSHINARSGGDKYFYDGIFYVFNQLRHNAMNLGPTVNIAFDCNFSVDSEGRYSMQSDRGFPSLRNFPSFIVEDDEGNVHKTEKISVGSSWKGQSIRSVDPLNNGNRTLIPFLAQYTYTGIQEWKGGSVYAIKCQWATRYGADYEIIDEKGDSSLVRASGKHSADILIGTDSGTVLLIKDYVDEIFFYSDGRNVAYKGNILIFSEGTAKISAEAMDFVNEEAKSVGRMNSNNISVEKCDRGLKFTMENLLFKADSAELLEDESNRLDALAQVLKKSPDSLILVEGHTARAGNPSNETTLSLERARTISLELIRRGVKESSIVCSGKGSDFPVADNSTEEGRRRNRRVEVTVLE